MFDYRDFKHGGDDSWWSLRLRANWKFAQENHVDGYHLPSIHPGLNSYSPLKNHYPLMIDGCASGQGSTSQDHAGALGGLALPCLELGEDWHKRAEFLSVFPNIMMGVHKDHFWTVYLIPEAPDQTFERMDIYYPGDGGTNQRYADLRAANRDRMLEIFEEDRAVIEGMQRGRAVPRLGVVLCRLKWIDQPTVSISGRPRALSRRWSVLNRVRFELLRLPGGAALGRGHFLSHPPRASAEFSSRE